ncbi:hypothetical protein C5167_047647 [Papaver somniferum]|uniref:Uncharacterized protein n=1 Tax=Papaver somniferum TaxID=3469 RepID=A0A4Y7LL47_PAPSO|nr:hypothetical protein C5167_047647 [Papaver somniferum]
MEKPHYWSLMDELGKFPGVFQGSSGDDQNVNGGGGGKLGSGLILMMRRMEGPIQIRKPDQPLHLNQRKGRHGRGILLSWHGGAGLYKHSNSLAGTLDFLMASVRKSALRMGTSKCNVVSTTARDQFYGEQTTFKAALYSNCFEYSTATD